jgi:hypothetical protein
MLEGAVLVIGMGLLFIDAWKRKPPAEDRHENRGKTLNAFIPLILLAIGTIEMAFKDAANLPVSHGIQTVIAVVCAILAIASLYLVIRLQMKETGKRGRS